MKRIFHSLLYSVQWIIAGVLLFYSTLYWVLSCNLFSWEPSLDWETTLCIVATVLVEVFFFWLARKTKGYIVIIVSFLVTVVLAAIGISGFIDFHQESLGDWKSSWIFRRDALSPEWFRITVLALFLNPLILWACYPFRRLIDRK